MKYHNLPTAKQIEAYNSGRMSVGERKWMDSMMKRNPFVKESVEAAKVVDMSVVARISSHMSTNVTAQYLTKVGFWSKYGGWISFGSIAVVIGLGAYFGPGLYNEFNKENNAQVEDAFVPQAQSEFSKESIAENKVSTTAEKLDNSSIPSGSENNETTNTVLSADEIGEDVSNETVILENVDQLVVPAEKVEEEKVVKDPAPKATVLTTLSAKKVIISSKFNPDDKAANNFPAYPSGDTDLCSYFKNKLRPIQVPDAEKYSKKATVFLQVNSKGKITSSSISGSLHPTHEAALNTAINNLPKFDAGKSNVKYSIVVSF